MATTDPNHAPGRPGDPPRWAPASKDGVGTAADGSRVWFTLGRGAVEEVYFPGPDRPRIAGLSFSVADGRGFVSDERTDATHRTERPDDDIPLYRLTNLCRSGRYTIEKTVYTHPGRDVLIQEVTVASRPDASGHLFIDIHLDPRLSDGPEGDAAWHADVEGRPLLFAGGGGHCLALACSSPWSARTVGFAGASDGRRDLAEHGRLSRSYGSAEGGTVSITGEVDLEAGSGRFVLALGFGDDPDGAAREAIAGLEADLEAIRASYTRGWREWQATLDLPATVGGAGRDPGRVGAAVLRTHMAKLRPGAVVASLSTPWGEAQTPGTVMHRGGYHLVWPRDQVEVAGGLLAVGAPAEARLVLDDLRDSQGPDGHWPQNMWCGGATFWEGVQLGETALPILLCDRLRREGVLSPGEARDYWPMIRRAVSYILGRGPSTQEDRWENQPGYTPFTLAAVIAALLVAADAADAEGEEDAAAYLRETADAWNASIDDWLYVEGTDLARRTGVAGYYLRVAPCDWADRAATATGRLDPSSAPLHRDGVPVTEVVSPDVLAFVRFGLRAPDDPRIVATIEAVDATLRVETPCGPCWHRYIGDGYGEHDDGTPYIKRDGTTRGRAWPLLTGERAHYELAAGRPDEAIRLLRAMESFAGDAGMIPEQVWDGADLPDRGLFGGRPTGSAMPLAWAHAEYLTLRRSLALGRPADCPPQTLRRYAGRRTGSQFVDWRTNHRRRLVPAGKALRIVVGEPSLVRWTSDDRRIPPREVATRDTTLGVHVADVPIRDVPAGGCVRFTIDGPGGGASYEVGIAEEPTPSPR